MLQERQDERRIKPLDLNLRRFDFEPAGGEAEQQLEGLRIRLAGMLACSAFFGQMLAQEAAQVRGERGHGAPPIINASPASAIWPMSSGVACKYQ